MTRSHILLTLVCVSFFICPSVLLGQDIVPPEILSIEPADGAVDVSPSDVTITVTFNEPMDRSSYPPNIFVTLGLNPSGSRVQAGLGSSDYFYQIDPVETLESNSVYAIHVLTGVTDISGNHLVEPITTSFTTSMQDADETPPLVVSVSPEDGATEVSPSSVVVQVTFNEAMDRSTYPPNIFITEGADLSGPRVQSSLGSYDTFYLVDPVSRLENETLYTVHVLTGVTDISGNHLVAPLNTSFTTGAEEIDTTPPYIVDFSPPDGAVDVSPSSVIVRVTFNEIMDRTSYPPNIFLTLGADPSGPRVQSALGSYDTFYLIDPLTILEQNTLYGIHVRTGVTDISGNHLEVQALSTFTTGSYPIDATSAAWGEVKALYR